MAFGQSAGPPAGGRQLDHLAQLLERAGFSSFKEARHPYGLTQRQAGGKFTVAEADELIERLEAAESVQQGSAPVESPTPTRSSGTSAVRPAPVPPSADAVAARRARSAQRKVEVLSAFDDDLLVAELERRGWCCIPPISTLDQEDGPTPTD